VNDPADVAVVTGGTHGIGRHAVELLAAWGWAVALCSRNADEAERCAAEISATTGAAVMGFGADVADESALRDFATEVVQHLGAPTAVLANAGVLGPVGALHEVDLGRWSTAVGTDLIGVANTVAVFGAQMVDRGVGSIVTMSGGGVGGPAMATRVSAYTSSKAAVVALTEAVAAELAPHGVRINAVAPGAIATRFMDEVITSGPEHAGTRLYDQTVGQRESPDSLDGFDALLRLLVDVDAPFITGRVLSARWDDPSRLRSSPPSDETSMFRMRRIDGELYAELTGVDH
jgi:NAD(P)-dependent dehydrogenase (short-subunit alcohol dehydrogenase family)